MQTSQSLKLLAAAAALSLQAFHAQAASILYIGNSNDSNYQAFVTGTALPGSTWTFKPQGTSAEQIGGDLDATRVLGGVSQTVKSYLNSFDLVISGIEITSTQWQDGADGADWASLTTKILVHSPFVARREGRLGLFDQTSSGFSTTQLAGSTNPDSAKLGSSSIADAIWSGVTSPGNLYSGGTVQGFDAASGIGGGTRVAELIGTTNASVSIAYWTAGATNGFGSTLNGSRAFFALGAGTSWADLTADGKTVLGNIITQLVPEPGTAITILAGATLLFFRRRHS